MGYVTSFKYNSDIILCQTTAWWLQQKMLSLQEGMPTGDSQRLYLQSLNKMYYQMWNEFRQTSPHPESKYRFLFPDLASAKVLSRALCLYSSYLGHEPFAHYLKLLGSEIGRNPVHLPSSAVIEEYGRVA